MKASEEQRFEENINEFIFQKLVERDAVKRFLAEPVGRFIWDACRSRVNDFVQATLSRTPDPHTLEDLKREALAAQDVVALLARIIKEGDFYAEQAQAENLDEPEMH